MKIFASNISFRIAGLTALLSLVLSSCWHHTKPARIHHKADIDYPKLFSKLQGTWISYEYILNLSKTTSPSQSSAFIEGIFSFTIDSSRLNTDTLHCMAWVNGREEKNLWIAFDSPDSLHMYSIGLSRTRNTDDNESQNANTDNITRFKIDSPYLIIYTSTFDSVRYVYYDNLPRHTYADYPLKHYTTAALFRGEYFTQDSNMIFGTNRIYFDPKNVGRILGSPIYDSFDINVNLLSNSDSLDYMELFDSRKQSESRSFTYTIKKNTLRIYPSADSTPCVLHKTEATDTLVWP